ncbi:molecular chaperone GrpE [Jannaschia faecimaris]|uniref:Protein GrpE n=1 Tax=Jannaschia faecimaris TaxID=1244108 RepID=A0A1H3Q1M8_9RHOB|nr:nucleotide exchange factor GrpE [Jannaschia faecimaris]SDZ07038.1 molecular chaperone GrpE [Jannaschia faecimaris]
MEGAEDKSAEDTASAEPDSSTSTPDLDVLIDKWKRALAEAENARKRAEASHLEGRHHGIATAVEALAPAYDAICGAVEAAQSGPDANNPRITAHLDGLGSIKAAFETGLKALGVRTIAPKDTPFDPVLHEAMQIHETDEQEPGEVLVLHRPGFAIGSRLIRPAHVTVSATPIRPADT